MTPTNLALCLLHGNAGHRPGRPALLTSAGWLGHEALAQAVGDAASRLAAAGVRAGDRVLVLFPNGPELVLANLAVLLRGAVAVPLAPRSGAERLRHAIDVTGPVFALLHDSVAPPSGLARVAAVSLDPTGRRLRFSPDPGPFSEPPPVTGLDDPAMILFSSGSTGRPNGVCLSHGNLSWTARALCGAFGLHDEHRDLVVGSLVHSGAWQRAAAVLFAGGALAFYDGALSVPGILEAVAEHEIHGFYSAPPLFRFLLQADSSRVRRSLDACRSLEVGSAAATADELSRLADLLPRAALFLHYGLTECSRATLLDVRAHPDRRHTVGLPSPGVTVAVEDADGRPLGSGRPGRIRLRGPQVARGYWGQPELTAERFVDGWVETGDHGVRDERGFLTWLGRRDDRINCGGHSFFPAEAEMALGPVQGIEQYLIAGVPDPHGVLGEQAWAFVVPSRRGRAGCERRFLEAAVRCLPPYMVPGRIIAVSELPVTPAGKPDRRAAVARYATSAEPPRES